MPKYTRTNSYSLPNLLAFQWQGPHVWGLKMWQIRTPLIVQCLAHIWPLLKTKRKKDPIYTTKKMERTHEKKWYRPQHFSHLHRKLVKTDCTASGLRTKFGRFCLHNTNSRQDISILIRNYSTVHAISEIITQAGLTMKKLRNTSFFLGKKKEFISSPKPQKTLGLYQQVVYEAFFQDSLVFLWSTWAPFQVNVKEKNRKISFSTWLTYSRSKGKKVPPLVNGNTHVIAHFVYMSWYTSPNEVVSLATFWSL